MIRRTATALALLSLTACQTSGPSEEATISTRVENAALELALASTPEPFVLAENAGPALRFSTTHETGGELTVGVGTPEYGLNLVAEATRQGDAFRAMESGEYDGSRELGTPWGPAYYSRGSYAVANGREEQTWIFGLHPAGDSRLLTLTYTYPAGEGQSRVNELLGILGEIEAFLTIAPTPAEETGDAPTP